MNTSQGALHFGASIDLKQFNQDLASMRAGIAGLTQTAAIETRSIDGYFKNLSVGIAGYFSVGALKSFAMELINVRGEFQKTEIAFSTMLGSADKAKALMGQMVDLAAKTPFGLDEVSAGAKQLLAFQVPANEVVDVLTRMGNIAAGLGVPLSRINLVYGQVKAKGKLMGDDLRQFTEAGIPMVAELAKKFNKTTGEITNMVSAGKIGFKDVQDVLFSMTNEGGMFFNLMEKQSASLSGKIANLGDSWDQMLNKIGESNEGVIYGGIEALNYLVENYKDVLDIIQTLIVLYGSYKAAVIVTSAAQTFANKTIQSEIALLSISEKMKLGRAMVTQRQAEATAREAAAEVVSTQEKYRALQIEVSSLAAKKQTLRQSGLNALAKLQEAKVQLSLAQLELSSMQAVGSAREIEIAQKRVLTSQNAVIAAQETATIAKNASIANSIAFRTQKQLLENTARAIGTAQGTAAVASEAAQIAAKNANAIATARLTIVTSLRTAATRLATQAQALLNATMLDNPYVLVIAAIAGLVYAYFKLRDTSTALTISEKILNDERERSTKSIEELRSKTRELTSVISSDTSTKLQQIEAYKSLTDIYPAMLKNMDLETFKKLSSTEAQKKLNAEMDKYSTQNLRDQVARAKSNIEDITKRIDALNERLKKRDGDAGIYLSQLENAKKNLEAQQIVLSKYNGELDERLHNEKLASMSLIEQKRYWEQQIDAISRQITAQETSNKKKAEAVDKLSNINSLVKTTSLEFINWNITPLLSQLNKAQQEISKINNAQSGTDVTKNKAFWEEQKKQASEANDAMSGRSADPKAWDANIRKIREATEELKKYDYTDKERLKSERERERERKRLEKGAEKAYISGSIKRLDQELNLLEDAKARANGDLVRLRYVDKYGKERDSKELISVEEANKKIIKLREDKAAREKEIQALSFEEQITETKRQIEVRDRLLKSGYSKEITDEMFPKVKDKTFLQYLNDLSKSLDAADTTSSAENLIKLQKVLSDYTEDATFVEKTNKQIDELKAKFKGDELIDKLEKFKKANLEGTTGDEINTKKNLIKKAQDEELDRQKAAYRSLLEENQSFAQRKIKIEKETAEAIKKINADTNLTPEQQKYSAGSVDKKSKIEISQLAIDELTKSKAWMALYGNIDELTSYQMQVLLKELESRKGDLSKVLTSVDFSILLKNFRDAKNKIAEENPFLGLLNSLQELFSAFGEQSEEAGQQAYSGFEKATQGINGTLKATKGIIASLSPAREYMSDTANDALDAIEQVTTMGMVMLQSIQGTVKAVKTALDKASWSNWITAIISIIYTVIRAIVSLFSWIAGSKTKKINREIKSWQLAVDDLKNSYEDLQRVIEKTAGEKQLSMQRELISNLKQQQQILGEIRSAESSKKKADQEKIASYSNAIHQIDVQIQQLVDDFFKSVTTTDFQDLATKLADAFIEGFGKGEDAAHSFEKVVDEVMKNAVMNALKVKLLQPVAEEFVNKLYTSMGFGGEGGPTSDQINLIKTYELAIDQLSEKLKNANPLNASMIKNQINQYKELISQVQSSIAANQMSGAFDGLTPEEIKLLKDGYKDDPRIKGFLEGIKNINELFDTTIDASQGLKGDIKGLTEKTGGAIEGQFNAIRINVGEVLKLMQGNKILDNAKINLLSQIEVNTRNLVQIRKDMAELNSK